MGKFININTKIPPLPRRLRPGFYGLTVIFYDTPKRNTQIPEQRSRGSRYRIAAKTVARLILLHITDGVGRRSLFLFLLPGTPFSFIFWGFGPS